MGILIGIATLLLFSNYGLLAIGLAGRWICFSMAALFSQAWIFIPIIVLFELCK